MKNLFKTKLMAALSVSCFFLTSCSQDTTFLSDLSTSKTRSTEVNVPESIKKQYLTQFAEILSKSISQREDLRVFLKEEALQMFDKNYDILYYPIKDKIVSGNLSFRDILVSNSSEKEISQIENNLPLLNILIPRISFLEVFPENLDTKDPEIPVAIENNNNGTDLYIKGEKVDTFDDNEFPGFNVIVVNLNNRVIASKGSATRSTGQNIWSYTFKSKNYKKDVSTRATFGSLTGRPGTHSSGTSISSPFPSYLYQKAKLAFEAGFNKNDNSINQIAFQRDYIYYGITPTKTTGELNRSVTEYLSYMIVDPKVYFKISDEQSGHINDDPYIKETQIVNKKNPLSQEEVLKRIWTQGAYNFIFEVSSSKSNEAARMHVPVFPEDLWYFRIKGERKKGGLFHRDKYRYTIDPTQFASKIFYFDPATVTFGKWNIAEESLVRYISIYEEDSGDEITETSTESFTHVHSSTFKGDLKIGLGLGKIGGKDATGDIGLSAETNSSNTTTTTNTISIKRHQGDDPLGEKVPIYFYDPIIISTTTPQGNRFGGSRTNGITRAVERERARSITPTDGKYIFYEYNTGSIRFGIDIR